MVRGDAKGGQWRYVLNAVHKGEVLLQHRPSQRALDQEVPFPNFRLSPTGVSSETTPPPQIQVSLANLLTTFSRHYRYAQIYISSQAVPRIRHSPIAVLCGCVLHPLRHESCFLPPSLSTYSSSRIRQISSTLTIAQASSQASQPVQHGSSTRPGCRRHLDCPPQSPGSARLDLTPRQFLSWSPVID